MKKWHDAGGFDKFNKSDNITSLRNVKKFEEAIIP